MRINIKQMIYAVAAVLVLIRPIASVAQPNTQQWKDLLLYSEFGEFCTMCEAVLLCSEDAQPTLEQAQPSTLYHLQTRTFWSQIATIWEWFVANFDTINGHQRPVVIYRIDEGRWSVGLTEELTITVEPALISMTNAVIDRRTSQWLNPDDLSPKGHCQRLPLWETLELIEAHRNKKGHRND